MSGDEVEKPLTSGETPEEETKPEQAAPPGTPPDFTVGIGASAGGLDALEKFLTHLPPDSGMAFIIVTHMDPSRPGMMPEILMRFTEMPVHEVSDGMTVRADTVYIIPSDADLSIMNGTLFLNPPEKTPGVRMPIDSFFRSLADDQGHRAVGILLSGMGSDGTFGIRAIKEHLGMVMVQDPATTTFKAMLESAIATGMVDFIAPAEALPDRLLKYAGTAVSAPGSGEALRKSEERFRLLTENASDVILILDPVGSILYASPSVKQAGGFTPEELIGRSVLELTHPDDLPLVMNALSTAAAHPKERVTLEVRFRHSSGDWLTFDVIGVNLLKEPAVRGFVVNARDITERKRAEEKLRESEEQFRAIFDNSSDGIVLTDPQGGGEILSVNPAACRMLGWTEEEIVGRGRDVLFDRGDPDLLALIDERRRTGSARAELTFRRKDGTSFPGEMSTALFRDVRGKEWALAIIRDITERRRAEDDLRTTKEYLENLIDYANAPIIVWNPEFVITRFNRAFESLTGIPAEEAVGARLEILSPEESRNASMEMIRRAMAGEMWDAVEIPILHRSGSVRTVLWNSANITGNGRGTPLATIAQGQDITGRKQAEEERAALTGRLEEAHREANLYLDIITHDIRNANNVSTMYADLMVDLAEGDLKTYAEKLRNSILRGNGILRNVATIRRVHEESVSLAPVSLDAVIREEVGNYPGASIRYDDRPVEVSADSLLPMIFANLIGNAVKFGGAGVEITVRVEERDDEVLVSVEDTGLGIPDEVKGLLFQRFERGMGRGRGEGLGLYIVRTLVERYGGKVRVEDRVPGHPGEGAAFRFTLQKANGTGGT